MSGARHCPGCEDPSKYAADGCPGYGDDRLERAVTAFADAVAVVGGPTAKVLEIVLTGDAHDAIYRELRGSGGFPSTHGLKTIQLQTAGSLIELRRAP